MSKAEEMYRSGFGRCLDIVKALGIEAAEQEAKNRGIRNAAPPSVTSYQLRSAARKEAEREIMIVACAMASTICEDMKLPSMKTKQFLRIFNDKCDLFHHDEQAYTAAQLRLDAMPAVFEMLKDYNKGEN